MARMVNWDAISDIEPLDAFGQFAVATVYPDGRVTLDDLRTEPPEED